MAVVGIGTDLVDVVRFGVVTARTPGVLERVFRPEERARLAGRVDPVPGLAARFAAKEAVFKALGIGLAAASLSDVEVGGGDGRPPVVQLHGRAAERAEALGVQRWHLSLTHTDALAQATALAET
jgi:holo-[acyl-carrier protein] synthase